MPNPVLEDLIMNCDINRIASPFQCLSLKEKITQYLLTSETIHFGQRLEGAMKDTLCFCGASSENMPKRIMGQDFDQLCRYEDKIIFIEQKVRDDHDSTKKVGQIQNYITKKEIIEEQYPNTIIFSSMWFIDPSFTENRVYYHNQIGTQLFYGENLFRYLVQEISPAFKNGWPYFLTQLQEIKEEIHQRTAGEYLFSQPIDISKISLSRLYDFMIVAAPKEFKEVFFAGTDPSEEIERRCGAIQNNTKIRLLMRLISDGYFK